MKPHHIVLTSLLLTACHSATDTNSTTTGGTWYRPTPLISWQWQLSGELNTTYSVNLYDIDLFDSSTDTIAQLQQQGSKVICYFSAGSFEAWRSDADSFSAEDLGEPLSGWPEERWLDIRSASVQRIMQQRIALAAEKGCDGIEPDNVDGYRNHSGFPLSAEHQLHYNRFIAQQAHQHQLGVGLKNNLDQIPALVDDFDFAINEQCAEYEECDALLPFIEQGKAVLHVEYHSRYQQPQHQQALCHTRLEAQFSSLVLALNLDDSYRHSCL